MCACINPQRVAIRTQWTPGCSRMGTILVFVTKICFKLISKSDLLPDLLIVCRYNSTAQRGVIWCERVVDDCGWIVPVSWNAPNKELMQAGRHRDVEATWNAPDLDASSAGMYRDVDACSAGMHQDVYACSAGMQWDFDASSAGMHRNVEASWKLHGMHQGIDKSWNAPGH